MNTLCQGVCANSFKIIVGLGNYCDICKVYLTISVLVFLKKYDAVALNVMLFNLQITKTTNENKMKVKLLIVNAMVLSLFLMCVSGCSTKSFMGNNDGSDTPVDVKVGTATVRVELRTMPGSEIEIPDRVKGRASTISVFQPDETEQLLKEFDVVNGQGECEVEMELTEQWALVGVELADTMIFSPVIAKQGVPVTLTIECDGHKWKNKAAEGGGGLAPDDALAVLEMWDRFADGQPPLADPEAYSSPERYIRYERDSLIPAYVEYLTEGIAMDEKWQDWFVNTFKYAYCDGRLMFYNQDARDRYGLNVGVPGIEFYNFLNDIDLDDRMLITIFPGEPLTMFKRILTMIPAGVNPIGDTPVEEWQEETRQKLKGALKNPSDKLMDLLAMAAYRLQMDDKCKPLSEVQLANIERHFTRNDIGKLLKQRNDWLVKSMRNTDENDWLDLTESEEIFELEKYMERFEGRPVVVDVWNTWCGPCVVSHEKLRDLKDEERGVEYVYVCDESSPKETWRNMTKRISGHHVRLSDREQEKFSGRYGIDGFPTYLFFDKEHNLRHKHFGAPTPEEYKEALDKLTE